MGIAHDPSDIPIIFLHGYGGFFMDWPRVMTPLSKRHFVVALDLPGWGFSEAHDDGSKIEDDAWVVLEFIKKMGLSNAILVGLSYGSAVAWSAASMTADVRLERVKEVLLLNPMPPHPIKHMNSKLYKGLFQLNRYKTLATIGNKFLTKSHYKAICKENLKHARLLDTFYLQLGYLVTKQKKVVENLYRHSKGAQNIDWDRWERELSKINLPTTIMQGLDDRIFSMESARYLGGLIPNSRLLEVDDCGHAIVFDRPQKVIRELIKLAAKMKSEKKAS